MQSSACENRLPLQWTACSRLYVKIDCPFSEQHAVVCMWKSTAPTAPSVNSMQSSISVDSWFVTIDCPYSENSMQSSVCDNRLPLQWIVCSHLYVTIDCPHSEQYAVIYKWQSTAPTVNSMQSYESVDSWFVRTTTPTVCLVICKCWFCPPSIIISTFNPLYVEK